MTADPIRLPPAALAPPPPATDTAPDFARLVGHAGWWRLAPDIRRRFSEKPAVATPIRYHGVMQQVWCSPGGYLLAQACRLLGTPFAPWNGRDVPVAIRLHQAADGGITWERVYHYPRRRVRVWSTKRLAEDGGLLECVGFGLGMRLAVFEVGGALHFMSLRYFWRVGRWLIGLPALLTPGVAHVIHEDLGQGRFRFTMSIRHRLLGTLFRQSGVFQREGDGQ